jgi:hypothetical protein
LGHDYLCRGDSLPDMPLGVIRDVHQQAGYGGRQILPADSARLI